MFAMKKVICKMQMMKFDTTVKTKRCVLTPLAESDIDDIFMALSETPQITRMLPLDPPTCREDTEGFVNWMIPRMPDHDIVWAVRMDGKFIGIAGINDIERKVLAWEVDNGNIGYWFVPEVAGQGIATEVAEALVSEGFERFNLHKISGRVVVGNGASERILEKVGFEKVGVQKEHFFRHDKWWDVMWLEVVNNNFVQEQG